MNIEDHIPQDRDVPLQEQINNLLVLGELQEVGALLTETLIDFFDFYRTEPILFKMLNIANSVIVSDKVKAATFNVHRRTMTLPTGTAALIESGHDLACLLLIERSRLIVNKQAHTMLPDSMDLKEPGHKVVFELARACWSSAVARCYCASTLPEHLYGKRNDFMSMLMHGAVPDQFVDMLHECKMPNVGRVYMALYQMAGQEQYHAAMNRMPMCSGTITFQYVLDSFWKDFEGIVNEYTNAKEQAKKEAEAKLKELLDSGDLSEQELEEMLDDMLDAALSYETVVNDDGSDNNTEHVQKQMQEASKGYSRHSGIPTPKPIVDIDADSDLDAYLAEVINLTSSNTRRHSYFFDDPRIPVPDVQSVRNVFQPLQHTVMLRLNDDEDSMRYGSMFVPERPSSRDLAMHLQGHTPMLWETRVAPQQAGAAAAYACYTDVSGSQFQWLPFVRALSRTLGLFVDPDNRYVFSDAVAPYDEKAAFVLTTGGTDIAAAITDARKKHLRNIILITDMEDSEEPVDTTGIDHIIIVLTDATEPLDLADTMFSEAVGTTKFDIYPITLDQLTVRNKDGVEDSSHKKHAHFNDMPDNAI